MVLYIYLSFVQRTTFWVFGISFFGDLILFDWWLVHYFDIAACRVVGVMKMKGSGSDDWIYSTSVKHSLLITLKYSAISDVHNLHFAVAHALGFSVFTSLLLATDLNTHYHFKLPWRLLVFSHSVLLCPNLYSFFTIHTPFSSLYSQLLNPPGFSTSLRSRDSTATISLCQLRNSAHLYSRGTDIDAQ
jgi:hypothetical protein